MNIKQVTRLLNDIGVETVATDTSLGPDIDYGMNYYMLKLNNETGKWEFIYVPHERRIFGGEEIRKIFDDEGSASKNYYLHELSSYYFFKYIQPFKLKNKELNIGRPSLKLENLKEDRKRLNMDTSYYSFGGKINGHSIFLERIDRKSVV